jgi:hypothetical protein
MPFVSGKDSLSSTYRTKEGIVIKIPPVLCCSAFGKVPDVRKTVGSAIVDPISSLVLLGKFEPALGGSSYYDTRGYLGSRLPKVDLKALSRTIELLYRLIRDGAAVLPRRQRGWDSHGSRRDVLRRRLRGQLFLDGFGQARPDHVLFSEVAGASWSRIRSECYGERRSGMYRTRLLGSP